LGHRPVATIARALPNLRRRFIGNVFLISSRSQSSQQLRILLEKCLIIPDFNSKSQMPQILDLMETYRNVPMSFADACLVCMVENNPGSTVFTLDRDFSVYRQQRRRLIPLIAPF
jgi:uncharacterized protein